MALTSHRSAVFARIYLLVLFIYSSQVTLICSNRPWTSLITCYDDRFWAQTVLRHNTSAIILCSSFHLSYYQSHYTMPRRSNSRPRRSRSGRPRHRSPSPITRARRRSHRSRSPPTHRRRNSPPPSSTPTHSTNLPPLPRLRRRHSSPAPTRRPDPRRSRSLSRRRPLCPRSPRPYRSPATFTTPRPIQHHSLHRPSQPDQRRPQLAHTHHRTSPQTQHHDALGSTPDQPSLWSQIPTSPIQLHPACHHHDAQLHQHNTPITIHHPTPTPTATSRLLRPVHLATSHQGHPTQHPHPSHYHPTTSEWTFPSTTCWHITFHPIKPQLHIPHPHHSNYQRSATPWAFPTTNNYKKHSPQPNNEPTGWHHTGNSTNTSAFNILPPADTYRPLMKPTCPTRKCSQTMYNNIWQEQWLLRAFPSAPSNPSPTTPTKTRTFGEWPSQNSQGHYSPNRWSQGSTDMHMQHPKAGSLDSYCLDVSCHLARISWGWISPPLAFSARRPWILQWMLSSRLWSIAVSQLRTVDPSSSQEKWLAVMQ